MAAENPPPPDAVTPRQFRLALLRSGIKPKDIDSSLAANEEALVEWQFASEVRRDHPLIKSMAAQMGKTQIDLNAIFTLASTL